MPTEILDKILPEEAVDFLIKHANDKRIQKAQNPVFLHYYISFDDKDEPQLIKTALNCRTVRMKTSILPEETFIEKVPHIIREVKDDFLQDKPVLYLYSLYRMPLTNSLEIKLALRYAVPDDGTILQTQGEIDKIINRKGLNYLLSEFGGVMENIPTIPYYIEKNYPEFKDKIRLWKILHGV